MSDSAEMPREEQMANLVPIDFASDELYLRAKTDESGRWIFGEVVYVKKALVAEIVEIAECYLPRCERGKFESCRQLTFEEDWCPACKAAQVLEEYKEKTDV